MKKLKLGCFVFCVIILTTQAKPEIEPAIEGDMILSPEQRLAIAAGAHAEHEDENFKANGNKFEGDMILSPEWRRALEALAHSGHGKRYRRTALIKETEHWPDGVVKYQISDQFSKRERTLIKQSMSHISAQTCIRFKKVHKNAKSDFVYIRPHPNSCNSDVGFKKGQISFINLQRIDRRSVNCFIQGIIVHELLHTLGIFHQQSSPDRDKFINVLDKNIKARDKHNFDKYPKNLVTDYGIGYDYSSIMHYGLKDFSKNGQPTMLTTKAVDTRIVGQRDNLSSLDVVQIKKMYQCP